MVDRNNDVRWSGRRHGKAISGELNLGWIILEVIARHHADYLPARVHVDRYDGVQTDDAGDLVEVHSESVLPWSQTAPSVALMFVMKVQDGFETKHAYG